MNLFFDTQIAKKYKNNSQIARVLTESWVKKNSYCPNCGTNNLDEFENNKPVADFFCGDCSEQFELKSKKGKSIGNKIVDGAYSTMIDRINSADNPNFFFLTYDKNKLTVNNFLIIPKHYFLPEIIERRKPLSENAVRAGWIGCNIDLSNIPENGKIFFIKNNVILPQKNVIQKWHDTIFLKNKKGTSKGWVLDIMNCIDKIKNKNFSLKDVYFFEDKLKIKYPNNNHIKDKIRQQLQILRDNGIIEFKGRGQYEKV